MMKIFYLLTFLFCFTKISHGASVDTLRLPSTIMKKEYKAAVILPSSYNKNTLSYPVMYLLHGGFEHFDAWLNKTSDKMLLHNIADKYNMIIVMPEGELFSFYTDSPFNPESQFETYITKEVVGKIDSTFRTIKSSKGRVIAGASMGGFGAIYLSNRHPDKFCAAGSMAGAMDLDIKQFKIPTEDIEKLTIQFENSLGKEVKNSDFSFKNSPINMLDKIKASNVKMIINCGFDDILLETNREFNRRLIYHKIPHTYIEQPGNHSWEYFEKVLLMQVQYFYDILKENDAVVL